MCVLKKYFILCSFGAVLFIIACSDQRLYDGTQNKAYVHQQFYLMISWPPSYLCHLPNEPRTPVKLLVWYAIL